MALVQLETGNDPWLSEHESCEKLSREILQQLNLRNSFPPGSEKFNAASASIRLHLRQFSHEVDQLKLNLLYSSTSTLEEKERRQRLVEDLESKNVQFSQELRMSQHQKDRNKLFDEPGDGGNGSWLDDSEQDRPLLGNDFVPSVDSLRRDQQDVLVEQDRGLENLSKVISRQKNIAITITNEVDLHNDLLNDISERMDSTHTSIQRENVSIRVITQKDNTFGYWLVIIILFLVIVFLAMF